MTFWLLASVALVVLLILLALLLPVSLSSSLQVRAEPSGGWALALGLGLGPIALSAISAAGVAPFMTFHVFGRQLMRLPLSRWLHRARKVEVDHAEAEPITPPVTLSRLEHSLASFFRSLDPLETVLSWWEKERIFQVRLLVIDVEYSFRDVALTGRILAGMYVLSALLPEHWQINQTPSWQSEDRLSVVADGRFRIWPGRLLIDVAGFVLKQRSRARQSAEPASE